MKIVSAFYCSKVQILTMGGQERHSPLMMVAARGQGKIVSLLLEKGADPDAKDNQRHTAIWHALDSRRSGVMKILVDRTSQDCINVHGHANPLRLAVELKSEEAVRLLLKAGAQIDFEQPGLPPAHAYTSAI
ncbi:hypothetical protein BDV06DRAFT_195552 [Aspergillus oleicola]